MSLLTALLAFVPALAPRKPVEDVDQALKDALANRDGAIQALNDANDQIVALLTEVAALRRENNAILAMVRERDRVIDRLSVYVPQPAVERALRSQLHPVAHPLEHEGQRAVYAGMHAQMPGLQQSVQDYVQAAQALLNQQGVPPLGEVVRVQWPACTCCPRPLCRAAPAKVGEA